MKIIYMQRTIEMIVKSKIELSADSLLNTKPTRVETHKEQIESLLKGRLKMAQNQEEKRKIKEQENIIHKQELEKKLIDKAIKVKKKQLKKIEIFDDLSDEDTTPATIQKPKQEKPKVIQAPKPVIINPYNEFKKKFNIN